MFLNSVSVPMTLVLSFTKCSFGRVVLIAIKDFVAYVHVFDSAHTSFSLLADGTVANLLAFVIVGKSAWS